MLPAVHILTGAAIGAKIGNPFLAILFGFLSHFVLDNIPHWDYRLDGVKDKGANASFSLANLQEKSYFFSRSAPKLALDFGLGALAAFFIAQNSGPINLIPTILGAGAAALPDIISGLGVFTNFSPIQKFREFHHLVHYPILQEKQTKKTAPSIWGIASQIIVAAVMLLVFLFF